jgi:hypothetical protein
MTGRVSSKNISSPTKKGFKCMALIEVGANEVVVWSVFGLALEDGTVGAFYTFIVHELGGVLVSGTTCLHKGQLRCL